MTTSTRECHVMDIGIERDLLKETIDQKESTWEGSIEEAMKKFRPELQKELWNKRSIYHLPAFIKLMTSSTVLTPQVVSFGPYHHGDPSLKLVEEYKQISLLRFLYKAKLPLRNVIGAMKEVVEELQAHYEYLEDKWKNKMEFLKIMITDGCFMLELLRAGSSTYKYDRTNDPIFGGHADRHIIPHIKKDMLMLENQLPLLALKVLTSLEEHGTEITPLEINNLVYKFFHTYTEFNTTALGLHVLDLYRKSITKRVNISVPKVRVRGDPRTLTAVELHEAGVQFGSSHSSVLSSIDFKEGILKLPYFTIDNATESTFLNLMAFEHLHAGLDDVATSYICFLGALINSASDVQLLRSTNMIYVDVTDKDAAEILNRLTKEVVQEYWISEVFDVHMKLMIYRGKIRGRVNRLLKTRVKKWFSVLMNLYFNNPWSTIGIIAAAVVIVLTFIQTYYAILSYKYSKK